MKLKTFKRFLKEEEDKKNLNAFIENTFAGNWSKTKTDFGNFIDEYHCGDDLYRIYFFPKSEIEQLTRISDLKAKIKGVLTTENQGHPRFYTKDDYNNIPDHLSFLSGIGQKIHGYSESGSEQTSMGIIFSRKAGSDNVDFSNYDRKIGNAEIAERIDKTKSVLSVNDLNIKIVANFSFEDKIGWYINPISNEFENDISNDEQPEENTDES